MKLTTATLASLALITSLGCTQGSGGPLSGDPLATPEPQGEREAALGGFPCIRPQINGVAVSGLYAGASVSPLVAVLGGASFVSWNFGGGATPNTSTAYNPTVIAGAPGNYMGSVWVSNTCGSSSYNFPYTIAANPWASQIGPAPTGQYVYDSSVTLFMGSPAVAWHDSTNGDLMFARTLMEQPGPGNWDRHVVDSAGDTGRTPQIFVGGDGRLKIVYQDFTNADLKIAQCVPATPANTASWNLTQVDTVGNVGARPSVAMNFNDIVVSYYDTGNQNLKVRAALVGSFPSGPASWTDLALPTLAVDDGIYSSVACANGTAYIAYSTMTNEVRYASAAVLAGATWTRYMMENVGIPVVRPGIVMAANGNPVMAYPGTSNVLRVAQAASTAPIGAAGWSIHTALDSTPVIFVHDMVLTDNKLAISIFCNQGGQGRELVAQSVQTTPTKKSDWYAAQISAGTNAGGSGNLVNHSLAGVDHLGITAYDSTARLLYGTRIN